MSLERANHRCEVVKLDASKESTIRHLKITKSPTVGETVSTRTQRLEFRPGVGSSEFLTESEFGNLSTRIPPAANRDRFPRRV